MHEMSLALSLVKLVEGRAIAEGADRVVAVDIAVGKLGHVEAGALEFCLGSAISGTLLEGADIRLNERDGMGWCFDCSTSVDLTRRGAPCPICGGYSLRLSRGDELKVTSMEIV